jgi:hypothetical protein
MPRIREDNLAYGADERNEAGGKSSTAAPSDALIEASKQLRWTCAGMGEGMQGAHQLSGLMSRNRCGAARSRNVVAELNPIGFLI